MKNNQVDVKEFVTYCEALDLRTITKRVAIQISQGNEELMSSYWKSLNTSTKVLVTNKLLKGNEKDLEDHLKIVCINNFGLDSDWEMKAKILHEGIIKCVRISIEKINEVRVAGYDWELIVKMLDDENVFRKWIEWGDKEERFKEIKEAFVITN